MSTAADIIRRSMKLLGLLAAGETPTSEEQSDGLTELNLLLDSWSNERLLVFGTRRNTYVLTPNLSPHTIGSTGTLVTKRPQNIEGAGVIMPGTTAELQLDLLTDTEYRSILDKTLASPIPTRMWMEDTYPNANLWFWPVPTTAAALALYTWSNITSFSAQDVVSLPPGYENALGHELAIRWAPQFGAEPSATLVQNALDARASIMRTNRPDEVVELDPALLGARAFNFYTG